MFLVNFTFTVDLLPKVVVLITSRTDICPEMPCGNLYKASMKEDTYLQGREHFIDLTNDPNVDGVYETQVSFFLS